MTQAQTGSVLNRLDALVGEWEMDAIIGGQTLGRARTTFGWIEGGQFLLQHAEGVGLESAPVQWRENHPFPIAAVIALDDRSERFYMNYSDGRGVHRVYEMTFEAGTWSVWGQAGPTFYQRFEGAFSEGGNEIAGHWDSSEDGSDWRLDFDVVYRRIR